MSTITNHTLSSGLGKLNFHFQLRRGMVFGAIILTALLAFEMFNFSTTEFALNDLLGQLTFASLRWSTILSIAFCGIDFAGIARLFTPDQGVKDQNEVWYLFGAWMLAATMNAILTWWGVSMAIINHQVQSTSVLDSSTILKVVPIFVAVMVWLIRILIIGSLSYAGDHIFGSSDQPRPAAAHSSHSFSSRPLTSSAGLSSVSPAVSASAASFSPPARQASNPVSRSEGSYGHAEPTYQSVSMSGSRAASSKAYTREADTRR
jgi:hypothetical protein